MSEIVSKVVEDTEVCVRCIVSPMFFSESRNKLKREAFLPAPNHKDVSLLRLRYTDLNRCKQHAKSLRIGDSSYCGLASIVKSDVAAAYEEFKTDGKEALSVDIEYSPMSEDGMYLPKDIDVHADDKGLPMHADLIYNTEAALNEIQTQMRKFANVLVKRAKSQKDAEPDKEEWTMGEFYNQ